MAGDRARSWYGWGWQDEALGPAAVEDLGAGVSALFGRSLARTPPPRLDEVSLPPSAVAVPATLEAVLSTTLVDRVGHTYGKAFRDVARAFQRRWDNAPDVVAYPRSEAEVTAVLDWAGQVEAAVIPYGGGSSVVGGVEADLSGTRRPASAAVSLDLRHISGIVEVDDVSRAARIRAGTFGPDADAALRARGLTMRHFPQSYEHSTVGGWVATRAGGHFATGPTHVDELVESLRAVTPAGIWESRRLPASGAGPSPDRLLVGSEGTLGVITEVWLRVHDRPAWRASAAVHLASLTDAATAARLVVQSGLAPSNCRLLDPVEARTAGVVDGSWVLLLGFESADHPVDAWIDRAVAIALDAGGHLPSPVRRSGPGVGPAGDGGDATSGWRAAFLRAPYLRDAMIALGCIAETFETACTWQDLPDLHATVTDAVGQVLREVCGAGQVGMRLTHVYPDGAAPYYTVLAPGSPGSLVAQWDDIKAAASEAIVSAGGTITHHHAVGRTHRDGYRRQRPDLFARALRAAKDQLDPAGVLNPGVLV